MSSGFGLTFVSFFSDHGCWTLPTPATAHAHGQRPAAVLRDVTAPAQGGSPVWRSLPEASRGAASRGMDGQPGQVKSPAGQVYSSVSLLPVGWCARFSNCTRGRPPHGMGIALSPEPGRLTVPAVAHRIPQRHGPRRRPATLGPAARPCGHRLARRAPSSPCCRAGFSRFPRLSDRPGPWWQADAGMDGTTRQADWTGANTIDSSGSRPTQSPRLVEIASPAAPMRGAQT